MFGLAASLDNGALTFVTTHHDPIFYRLPSEASPETFDISKSNAEIKEVEILIRQKLEQLI
ncbi:hypothetical protein [Nostoc sp.]|uniref:hypothetical protein n=1 Tax=Nostoc sp. TaxID=1180 RepID=UPI002FFAD3AF